MRKGMTLIELIFSMVIISIVFSIVPKIIFASNKSMEASMKEDALFSAYTLMGSITKLAWDENTLSAGKILHTGETDCTTQDRRVGSFHGSRNCIDSNESASVIGQEATENTIFDDVDDYANYNENVVITINSIDINRYEINASVQYVKKNNYTSSAGTSDLKEIEVVLSSHTDNKKITNFKSSFFYYSANLGNFQIKKELWQ